MVTIKAKYHGKTFAGGSYVKAAWDEVYLEGRAGETPMEYDYARTAVVNYNRMGLAMGERDWRG